MHLRRSGLVFAFFALIISACSGNNASTTTPTPILENTLSPMVNPSMIADSVVKSDPIDIAPGISVIVQTPTPNPTATPSALIEPVYGSVLINNANIITSNGTTIPEIRIQGLLPTPCHKLIIKVDPITIQNTLSIHVLSSADLQVACIQKLQPFDQTIRLLNIPPNRYTIWVNGINISTITIQ